MISAGKRGPGKVGGYGVIPSAWPGLVIPTRDRQAGNVPRCHVLVWRRRRVLPSDGRLGCAAVLSFTNDTPPAFAKPSRTQLMP
jgi:hypothetical protein